VYTNYTLDEQWELLCCYSIDDRHCFLEPTPANSGKQGKQGKQAKQAKQAKQGKQGEERHTGDALGKQSRVNRSSQIYEIRWVYRWVCKDADRHCSSVVMHENVAVTTNVTTK
jgi:hypothetical protein